MQFLRRNIPIFLTGIALLIIFAILIGIAQIQGYEGPVLTTVEDAEVIAAHTYTKGSPKANFQLVMFTGYSSKQTPEYYETFRNLYENNRRYLSIALRHYPQTEKEKLRAKAVQAAGEQNKFWEYSDKLFEKIKENKDDLGLEELLDIGEEIDINRKKFRNDIENESFTSFIEADMEDANKLGITKAPAFFLNKEKLEINNAKELEEEIQEQIDQIKKLQKTSQNHLNTPEEELEQEEPTKAMSRDDMKKLQSIKEISFTEEGWDPREAAIVKGQVVRWTNETEETIEIEELDYYYREEFAENKVLEPGESFEFKFTVPGIWRYQEARSKTWGSIFAKDH